MMGGDIIYPTSPPPSYPQYPTASAMPPFYPPHQPYPPQQFLPPPLALVSTLTPMPWPMVSSITLPAHLARLACTKTSVYNAKILMKWCVESP
jgi:hypothetical protein